MCVWLSRSSRTTSGQCLSVHKLNTHRALSCAPARSYPPQSNAQRRSHDLPTTPADRGVKGVTAQGQSSRARRGRRAQPSSRARKPLLQRSKCLWCTSARPAVLPSALRCKRAMSAVAWPAGAHAVTSKPEACTADNVPTLRTLPPPTAHHWLQLGSRSCCMALSAQAAVRCTRKQTSCSALGATCQSRPSPTLLVCRCTCVPTCSSRAVAR